MEKLLLVKGIEGLGNRILCMLTASLYAQLTGRKLVVDWRDECYATGGINAFDHFFLSPLCLPHSKVPETNSVAPEIWRGHLDEPAWLLRERHGALNDANGWRAFSIDLGRLDYPQHVAVMWTYEDELNPLIAHLHAAGKPLSNEDRFVILRSLLHDNFVLHPHIREVVDRFKKYNFTGRTIGVHIRYSDYRTALRQSLNAVYELTDFDPACRIFVCTDNIQIKRMFEREFRNVVSTPHWFPSTPGLPLHYDMNRPDPLLTGIESLVDLYLLSECDELVVDTSSSFAYVAALLTNSPVHDKKRRDKLSPRIRHMRTALLNKLRFQSWAPEVTAKLVRQQRRLDHRSPANRSISPAGAPLSLDQRWFPQTIGKMNQEKPSFSVVICTRNRVRFLRDSTDSLLAQEYPLDRFEVIVIDNGSGDETKTLVESYRLTAPIPVSYHAELRPGTSLARNLGIEKARYEFVAFLDDDAIASPGWLAAFAIAVREHAALAGGGPVMPILDSGVELPIWWEQARNLFGLDHSPLHPGQGIVAIRWPLWLGGCNCFYSRRLLQLHGAFHTDCGPVGERYRVAEDIDLNVRLERAGIPIFYVADAWIRHRITVDRLSNRYLWRRMFCAGVTDAHAWALLNNHKAPPAFLLLAREALRTALGGSGASSVRGFNFGYPLGYLVKNLSLGLKRRLGGPIA